MDCYHYNTVNYYKTIRKLEEEIEHLRSKNNQLTVAFWKEREKNQRFREDKNNFYLIDSDGVISSSTNKELSFIKDLKETVELYERRDRVNSRVFQKVRAKHERATKHIAELKRIEREERLSFSTAKLQVHLNQWIHKETKKENEQLKEKLQEATKEIETAKEKIKLFELANSESIDSIYDLIQENNHLISVIEKEKSALDKIKGTLFKIKNICATS